MAGEPPPPKPADAQSFLQAMMKEQFDQARQHETMRQQGTSIVLVLVGAIAAATAAGMSATLGWLYQAKIPWAVMIFSLLGWVIIRLTDLGRQLSTKHYERNRLHIARANEYRRSLQKLFPNTDYGGANQRAREAHGKHWAEEDKLDPGVVKQRLHFHWANLFTFARHLGLAMVVVPIAFGIALTLMLDKLK